MGRWIIDAGHGGKDNGAIGPGGRREKNISLDAALEAKRVLELNGEEVFLIRSNDIYMELKERVTYANGWGGDYYISFHMNFSDSDSIEGTEVFIKKDNSKSKEFGEYLLDKMVKGFKSENRGLSEIDYGVLNSINIPGAVCLGDYISNRQVERNFNAEYFGRVVANACVQLVGKIPKEEGKKNKGIKKEVTKDYGWRVCVGVYEDFEEAKRVVQDIQARGVSNVYIIHYIGKSK